ncbi:hypothetical protein AcV7_010284 [Taiwanofungus camphoratus]|nr:hypothetical protein AcV7_010284 [Antrodia cinnamomea]
MRPTALIVLALSLGAVHASWFGSSEKPEYTSWSTDRLKSWLAERQIPVPTTTTLSGADLQALVKANWDAAASWSADQSVRAQAAFADLKADAFDAWDESRLREFLLEHGVVEPHGTREQLALLAKQKWTQASAAASSASARASTGVYGDWTHQATKSAGSAVAQATAEVAREMDDAKDYVYSTWDDNRLRSYLEEKGVLETKAQASRNELLAKMRDAYAKITEPIWHAWSDSCIHEWLVQHGILRSDAQKHREAMLALMHKYYYGLQERAWSAWADADMKWWLVEHGIIKTDAQLQREKLEKLLADNYAYAHDTVWGAWSDSDMKAWLVEHGYLRSDAQKRRDDLVRQMQDKYTEYSARTAPYLVWPDARLRAYLRERGVSEDALPTGRPGLLQETRIRYVQAQTRAEALFARVRDVINGGVEAAEDKLGKVLDILTGHVESAKERAGEKAQWAKEHVWDGEEKEKKVEL